MNIPDDRRYRESHEWARQQGDLVTVGISDYAQDQLGDVVFVELPPPGRKVESGEPIAVVESVKTASDIYAPLAGEVIEVNESLVDNPELINGSPYEDGWMFRIRPAADASLASLLDAAGYEAIIEEEA